MKRNKLSTWLGSLPTTKLLGKHCSENQRSYFGSDILIITTRVHQHGYKTARQKKNIYIFGYHEFSNFVSANYLSFLTLESITAENITEVIQSAKILFFFCEMSDHAGLGCLKFQNGYLQSLNSAGTKISLVTSDIAVKNMPREKSSKINTSPQFRILMTSSEKNL